MVKGGETGSGLEREMVWMRSTGILFDRKGVLRTSCLLASFSILSLDGVEVLAGLDYDFYGWTDWV
tara:strand:+ start:1544 stop:1741 length:198 start_codon:yes stop_codon:yes gene_type:complete